ncbi:hypothetical protein Cgig2_024812 [Carnegiea gigantea]|uniref:AMP-activated protein kinase glycogen-binding domain-containing protein n=1 Tax=Carnegiea gigantea TaxID=171969 RepID=A0A9Q1QI91_9CARY|nr:hypothetical protein Cgig2_024812 [Carnegiea gigantea]
MVSLITASSSSAHFTVFRQPLSHLNLPPRFFSVGLLVRPPKRQHPRKRVKEAKKNQFLFGSSDYYRGFVRMCKREGGQDEALELELLEFMKNSKNPEMFPSKRELIESGRADLAEAIEKSGGWMSMGWEDDDEGEIKKMEIENGSARNWVFEVGKNGYEVEAISGSELNVDHGPGRISFMGDSSPASSSSGRSLETTTEDDSGIEGILNRLERQRSLSFGLRKEKHGSINHNSMDAGEDEQSADTLKDAGNSYHAERNSAASMGRDRLNRSYSNISSSSVRPDTWRTWSIQRAGISNTEFEAAEIDFVGSTNGQAASTFTEKIMVVTPDIKEPVEKTKDVDSSVKEISQSDIKTRVQHLELELSSVLHSLRSNNSDLCEKISLLLCHSVGSGVRYWFDRVVKEHMSEDLRKLSDASEFQENEIMSAQEKLRSIRAKLAVLEGKMALAITDAQKVLDQKQKRIDNARRALQLLRSTCIVWPNSASEVLLVGSFDGWATQRKMEKLSTGIFSLSLKLFPGQYEIKFIVDGTWKLDPLRPIINNGGFENNLLIVTY